MTKEPAICVVDGCGATSAKRGWCSPHYERWRRHGDPTAGNMRYRTPQERIAANTEPDGDCLAWTAYLNAHGYGVSRHGGRNVLAHRLSWELANGPIPEGRAIDHICHNRACVKPEHLRLAVASENQRNRRGPVSNRKHDLPRGVYVHGPSYRVMVQKGGKLHSFGSYPTVEEAAAVAASRRLEMFGEFAGKG